MSTTESTRPGDYPRRVLVAVSGLSPAILTETIYGLAHAEESERFIPTEVHLITTSTGKEQAVARLLGGEHPIFSQLMADYPALEGIVFNADNIHVISDENGQAIGDLTNQQSNEAAADFICNQIFDYTSDPQAAVHVSIAGGRKTMGFYVGYALSLFGRIQDRLSHVLVSHPYDLCKTFYYPTPNSQTAYYEMRGQDLATDFKDASVDLAAIPFVRITNLMKKSQYNKLSLVKGHISFSETIKFAEASALDTIQVEIDIDRWEMCINGITKSVNKNRKMGFLFLITFLESIERDGAVKIFDKTEFSKPWRENLLKWFALVSDPFAIDGKQVVILEEGMSYDQFSDGLSKARILVQENYGHEIREKLLPKPVGSVIRVEALNLTLSGIE